MTTGLSSPRIRCFRADSGILGEVKIAAFGPAIPVFERECENKNRGLCPLVFVISRECFKNFTHRHTNQGFVKAIPATQLEVLLGGLPEIIVESESELV